jgi:DNA-binding response OmpR family regulator
MADVSNKKVLVVEDDVFLAQLLTNRISKAGVNVVRAADGEEGLSMLRSEKPDLMLLDLILPKKSGFELLEEMRADPALSNTPVIIVSNLGQEGDIKKGRELGAVEYFVKAKTSIDGLVERVKAILSEGDGAPSS